MLHTVKSHFVKLLSDSLAQMQAQVKEGYVIDKDLALKMDALRKELSSSNNIYDFVETSENKLINCHNKYPTTMAYELMSSRKTYNIARIEADLSFTNL